MFKLFWHCVALIVFKLSYLIIQRVQSVFINIIPVDFTFGNFDKQKMVKCKNTENFVCIFVLFFFLKCSHGRTGNCPEELKSSYLEAASNLNTFFHFAWVNANVFSDHKDGKRIEVTSLNRICLLSLNINTFICIVMSLYLPLL